MAILDINRQIEQPLVEQIVQGLSSKIDARILRAGSKIPSIRQFASEHSVSRFTVVQAYDRLVASGHLNSRKGSGFYVGQSKQEQSFHAGCQLERANDVLWLLRQALKDGQHRYQPGCGWLPYEWLDAEGVQRSLRALSRAPAKHLVEYGQAAGFLPLRQSLQHRLEMAGIKAGVEQIITCHGASHGLDMVTRLMLKPGDVVLVDDPAYFNLFGMLRLAGAEVVGVPRLSDGPDMAALKTLLQVHKPKLFVTTSVLQNPTGSSISPAVSYELLRLAEQHDFYLIEDDVYGDFHPNPPPRLAALDQLNRVIYVSSFSKTISANLRVGFIACRQDLAHELLDLKLLSQLTTGEIGERAIHHTLAEGHYRKHVRRVRSRLDQSRDFTLRQLELLGFTVPDQTEHGMFVWAKLPECKSNAVELAALALKQDVVLAPGNIFKSDGSASRWMRFNVANSEAPMFKILSSLL